MCISQKVKVAIFRSSHPEVFFKKRCSESMQQIYRRTLMQKCDFNKVALRDGCPLVVLLNIFSIPLLKNTSARLLLNISHINLIINLWKCNSKKSKMDNYLVCKYKNVQVIRKLFVTVNVA